MLWEDCMGLYSGYQGRGLNHVELLYQPGERALAIKFATLLGCATMETSQTNDTGSTYICVHPDADDRDMMNNIMYLSEMRAPQRKLEEVLRAKISADKELADATEIYRDRAKNHPFGVPHFGLRFPSFESIEPVLDRLERNDDPEMKGRYSLKVIRPDNAVSMTSQLIQAFVYTDIVATGLFSLGQVIELQAQRAAA